MITTEPENTTPTGEEEEAAHVLVCQQCQFPLVLGSSIIAEKADVWKDQVYPYELDILELEDVWCYSATNPGRTRFDLVRAIPNPNITFGAVSSPEHSFFPGYAWNMMTCKCCKHFFGWGFTKINTEPSVVAAVASVLALLSNSLDLSFDYPPADELEENLFPNVDFLGYVNVASCDTS
eukprot:TRINITY_DN6599_c0_g1_i1.p1 TRINITY_DN6599_c0_g1~~TRINITY_DN6599_c0_g1_i1.p1  ORF type:complete len:199 (+),score=36.19 TRINITY_DN6599_c0_g1_i1:61-597(+)